MAGPTSKVSSNTLRLSDREILIQQAASKRGPASGTEEISSGVSSSNPGDKVFWERGSPSWRGSPRVVQPCRPWGHSLTPSLWDWAAGSPASLQLGDTWCSFGKPPSHLSIHMVQLCPPTISSTLYACTQMHTLTHSCTHMFSHTNPHTPHISSPWVELHIWSDGEASLATAADCEPWVLGVRGWGAEETGRARFQSHPHRWVWASWDPDCIIPTHLWTFLSACTCLTWILISSFSKGLRIHADTPERKAGSLSSCFQQPTHKQLPWYSSALSIPSGLQHCPSPCSETLQGGFPAPRVGEEPETSETRPSSCRPWRARPPCSKKRQPCKLQTEGRCWELPLGPPECVQKWPMCGSVHCPPFPIQLLGWKTKESWGERVWWQWSLLLLLLTLQALAVDSQVCRPSYPKEGSPSPMEPEAVATSFPKEPRAVLPKQHRRTHLTTCA